MRSDNQYLPDPYVKPSKEQIEKKTAFLKKLEESYCKDKPHEWKYWGGTRGLYKLRSCKVCYKSEKFVEKKWIDT